MFNHHQQTQPATHTQSPSRRPSRVRQPAFLFVPFIAQNHPPAAAPHRLLFWLLLFQLIPMTNSFVNSSRNALLSCPCRIVPEQNHQWTSRLFPDILRIFVPVERVFVVLLDQQRANSVPFISHHEFLLLHTFCSYHYFMASLQTILNGRDIAGIDRRAAVWW